MQDRPEVIRDYETEQNNISLFLNYYFLLVENPWHLKTSINKLVALEYDYANILQEVIELKNDTNLEVIKKKTRGIHRIFEFTWKILQKKNVPTFY